MALQRRGRTGQEFIVSLEIGRGFVKGESEATRISLTSQKRYNGTGVGKVKRPTDRLSGSTSNTPDEKSDQRALRNGEGRDEKASKKKQNTPTAGQIA